MSTLAILGIIHVALCVAALIISFVAKEDKFKLLISLFFVPFLGPLVAIIFYFIGIGMQIERDKSNPS